MSGLLTHIIKKIFEIKQIKNNVVNSFSVRSVSGKPTRFALAFGQHKSTH